MSRPTRARGLKLLRIGSIDSMASVAPHAGAWIETDEGVYYGIIRKVAPHAGAWIETQGKCKVRESYQVAPHAGAWIETYKGVR